MKIIKMYLLILLIAMVPASALGAGSSDDDAVLITTDDARELALSNNLDIQAGLAAIDTARAQISLADNQWAPRLSSSYTYTRLAEVPVMKLPPGLVEGDEIKLGTENNYVLGLQFVWPLYTGGEKGASVRLAKLSLEGLQTQQEILEAVTGVLAQNYCLSLREARGAVVAQKKSLEYIDGLVNSSEKFYEQGLIPKNDLLRVKVQQTNTRQAVDMAINNERLAQDQLNSFIGFDFGTQLKIDVLGYQPFFFEADLEPFYQLALKQRPEMKAMALQYEILDEQRKMAQAGRLPNVSLVVSYQRSGDTAVLSAPEFGDADSLSGILQITYDLYDGGQTSESLHELAKRERELDIAKQKLERDIYLELEQAYISIKQAYNQITATNEAITQAEENLRIARSRFDEGLLIINDVIEAEALLLEAQLKNQKAIYDYYRAAAYVGKAVGVADINYYLELKDIIGIDDGNENEN